MLLGTISVVGVLNKMLKQVKNSFSKVSASVVGGLLIISENPMCGCTQVLTTTIKVILWIATFISWLSHINSKVFLIRNEFNAMVETATVIANIITI
jgi:hypothetical protein